MRFGMGKKPRLTAAGRRGAYRPKIQYLEERLLLAIDLGANIPPGLPNIATFPYGIDLAGALPSNGAGFSVTDLGDVNGDGYDDFFIGGPTVINNGGQISLDAGVNSQSYLIFGSRAVNAGNIDWLTLHALETAQNLPNGTFRVGDLGQLGNAAVQQQNPINGLQGFPFDGLSFITSQNTTSQLGASVASAGIINGTPAFLIGAPGANDVSNTIPFTGRAYLIYGGASINNLLNKTIDLDNPGGNQGVTFVSFEATASFGAARIGRAVSGAGDFFAEGSNAIAIGAPNATYNGNSNAGAVFVVSGFAIPNVTSVVSLNAVGQNGGRRGVVFGGAGGNNNAGFSLANAGSVDGALSVFNARVPDLLIGAPGADTAYLVYGGTNVIAKAANLGGINSIVLSRIGDTVTTPTNVLGAAFTGLPGDGTGYAVSSAGDFNNDGLADIMIGSPFALAQAGRVNLIYGQTNTLVNGARVSGVVGNISLLITPPNFQTAIFTGNGAGALAGYSVSLVGKINNDAFNEVLIGSPGENNNDGAVYVIPGNTDLEGTFNLGTVDGNQPVAATRLTLTNPSVPIPAFFGASVSGRLTQLGQTRTADGDLVADFIIGAPGYGAIAGRGLDGGAFIIQGAALPLLIPVSTAITTTIGVGAPFGPFVINATAPNALQIYVFSNAAANFDPVRDINPATVVVNGVAYPNATVAKDPVDENNDGIEDAIITITPRSNLGLLNGTQNFTFRARTRPNSPNANRVVTGSTSITVTGGTNGGGGGGGIAAAVPIGLIVPTTFVPPFGNDRFVPAPSTLSRLNWTPLPWKVAYRQFQPATSFEMRSLNYFYPSKFHYQPKHASKYFGADHGRGVSTLGQHTFDRGVYHAGKTIEFTHKKAVIPTQLQTERLSPTTPLGGHYP